MGQAKLRGNFEARKTQAITLRAHQNIARQKKLADEQFALNEWRLANPEAAEKQRQANLKTIQTITLLHGMSDMLGNRFIDKLRR